MFQKRNKQEAMREIAREYGIINKAIEITKFNLTVLEMVIKRKNVSIEIE